MTCAQHVLATLREHGPRTVADIAAGCSEAWSSRMVRRAVTQLLRSGQVVDLGTERRGPAGGRPSMIISLREERAS